MGTEEKTKRNDHRAADQTWLSLDRVDCCGAMPSLLSCCLFPLILAAMTTPALAFEPLQKSLYAAPAETTTDLNVEEVTFTSDDLKNAESSAVTPAAPGEKGRAPKGYSLLDLGF